MPEENIYTNEELDQILEAFQENGWTLQISSEQSSDLVDYIPLEGEMINLIDRGLIVIGDGETPLNELPALSNFETTIGKDDLASVQADKLWSQLVLKVKVYHIWQGVVPAEVLSELIRQKPANFSLMLGEAIPDTSPAFQFMQTAPNAKGSVLRNISHGDAERDPDGVDLSPGQYQKHALKEHPHPLIIKSTNPSATRRNKDSFEWNPSSWRHPPPGERMPRERLDLFRGYLILSKITGAGTGKETRMANIRSVIIWRIA